MQENKELELLREFFAIELQSHDELNELTSKILEIQKQNKLKRRLTEFKEYLNFSETNEFNEILKELGYNG